MQHIAHRLKSWWHATMVPEHAPVLTIDDRERMRKRRLLSTIILFRCVVAAPWLLVRTDPRQQIILAISICLLLCALFINRQGYLKPASLCYLLTDFTLMALSLVELSLSIPIAVLTVWSLSLTLLVIAGLLLPSWGALLLTGMQVLFLAWLVLVGRHSQIAAVMGNATNLPMFLFFASTVTIFIGLLSALSATITTRAVIEADRAVELEQAHDAIAQAYAIIQKQALTDGLTNLPNHRALVEQLGKEMERARRHKRPFSILFFDADRFKQVNDTYGHAAGDCVLREIGARANSILRKEDTLGRFGGEEFLVLLTETDHADAEATAERVRVAVAAHPVAIPELHDGLNITVSIGVATYPLDGENEDMLLTAADEAMYIAKRMGRNQVRTAEEARQMSTDIELTALLEQEKQRDAAQREGQTLEHLREAYTLKIVRSLLCLLERRDEHMHGHAYGVSELATALARQMQLDDAQVARIGKAALLHDIGKVAIPDALLHRTGALSWSEEALMKDHAELGAQILEASPFTSDLAPLVHYHHEHWNGDGYPEHLAGEAIPLAARIIAVAEAYDGLQRTYPARPHCTAEEALSQIQARAGHQFDPAVVETLAKYLAEQHTLHLVPQAW